MNWYRGIGQELFTPQSPREGNGNGDERKSEAVDFALGPLE